MTGMIGGHAPTQPPLMVTHGIRYSFVVIAFNEAPRVALTLQSIYQLRGLFDFEVIVVDDGSTDGTNDVVRSEFGSCRSLRMLTLPENQGRGAARNAGVAACRGEYVSLIDADIVLPSDWLIACSERLADCDACSGTPVPDGDVSYVASLFDLKAKPVPATGAITGSNLMCRKSLLNIAEFKSHLRYGEDTDFAYQLENAGFRTVTIPHLYVKHHEGKSFIQSVKWMYQNGLGASRQLFASRRLRLPDFAFGGFLMALMVGVGGVVAWHTPAPLILVPFYLVLTAGFHVRRKFYCLLNPSYMLHYLGAVLVNTVFIGSYSIGRLLGMVRGSRT